jgi:hypothetical protein
VIEAPYLGEEVADDGGVGHVDHEPGGGATESLHGGRDGIGAS